MSHNSNQNNLLKPLNLPVQALTKNGEKNRSDDLALPPPTFPNDPREYLNSENHSVYRSNAAVAVKFPSDGLRTTSMMSVSSTPKQTPSDTSTSISRLERTVHNSSPNQARTSDERFSLPTSSLFCLTLQNESQLNYNLNFSLGQNDDIDDKKVLSQGHSQAAPMKKNLSDNSTKPDMNSLIKELYGKSLPPAHLTIRDFSTQTQAFITQPAVALPSNQKVPNIPDGNPTNNDSVPPTSSQLCLSCKTKLHPTFIGNTPPDMVAEQEIPSSSPPSSSLSDQSDSSSKHALKSLPLSSPPSKVIVCSQCSVNIIEQNGASESHSLAISTSKTSTGHHLVIRSTSEVFDDVVVPTASSVDDNSTFSSTLTDQSIGSADPSLGTLIPCELQSGFDEPQSSPSFTVQPPSAKIRDIKDDQNGSVDSILISTPTIDATSGFNETNHLSTSTETTENTETNFSNPLKSDKFISGTLEILDDAFSQSSFPTPTPDSDYSLAFANSPFESPASKRVEKFDIPKPQSKRPATSNISSAPRSLTNSQSSLPAANTNYKLSTASPFKPISGRSEPKSKPFGPNGLNGSKPTEFSDHLSLMSPSDQMNLSLTLSPSPADHNEPTQILTTQVLTTQMVDSQSQATPNKSTSTQPKLSYKDKDPISSLEKANPRQTKSNMYLYSSIGENEENSGDEKDITVTQVPMSPPNVVISSCEATQKFVLPRMESCDFEDFTSKPTVSLDVLTFDQLMAVQKDKYQPTSVKPFEEEKESVGKDTRSSTPTYIPDDTDARSEPNNVFEFDMTDEDVMVSTLAMEPIQSLASHFSFDGPIVQLLEQNNQQDSLPENQQGDQSECNQTHASDKYSDFSASLLPHTLHIDPVQSICSFNPHYDEDMEVSDVIILDNTLRTVSEDDKSSLTENGRSAPVSRVPSILPTLHVDPVCSMNDIIDLQSDDSSAEDEPSPLVLTENTHPTSYQESQSCFKTQIVIPQPSQDELSQLIEPPITQASLGLSSQCNGQSKAKESLGEGSVQNIATRRWSPLPDIPKPTVKPSIIISQACSYRELKDNPKSENENLSVVGVDPNITPSINEQQTDVVQKINFRDPLFELPPKPCADHLSDNASDSTAPEKRLLRSALRKPKEVKKAKKDGDKFDEGTTSSSSSSDEESDDDYELIIESDSEMNDIVLKDTTIKESLVRELVEKDTDKLSLSRKKQSPPVLRPKPSDLNIASPSTLVPGNESLNESKNGMNPSSNPPPSEMTSLFAASPEIIRFVPKKDLSANAKGFLEPADEKAKNPVTMTAQDVDLNVNLSPAVTMTDLNVDSSSINTNEVQKDDMKSFLKKDESIVRLIVSLEEDQKRSNFATEPKSIDIVETVSKTLETDSKPITNIIETGSKLLETPTIIPPSTVTPQVDISATSSINTRSEMEGTVQDSEVKFASYKITPVLKSEVQEKYVNLSIQCNQSVFIELHNYLMSFQSKSSSVCVDPSFKDQYNTILSSLLASEKVINPQKPSSILKPVHNQISNVKSAEGDADTEGKMFIAPISPATPRVQTPRQYITPSKHHRVSNSASAQILPGNLDFEGDRPDLKISLRIPPYLSQTLPASACETRSSSRNRSHNTSKNNTPTAKKVSTTSTTKSTKSTPQRTRLNVPNVPNVPSVGRPLTRSRNESNQSTPKTPAHSSTSTHPSPIFGGGVSRNPSLSMHDVPGELSLFEDLLDGQDALLLKKATHPLESTVKTRKCETRSTPLRRNITKSVSAALGAIDSALRWKPDTVDKTETPQTVDTSPVWDDKISSAEALVRLAAENSLSFESPNPAPKKRPRVLDDNDNDDEYSASQLPSIIENVIETDLSKRGSASHSDGLSLDFPPPDLEVEEKVFSLEPVEEKPQKNVVSRQSKADRPEANTKIQNGLPGKRRRIELSESESSLSSAAPIRPKSSRISKQVSIHSQAASQESSQKSTKSLLSDQKKAERRSEKPKSGKLKIEGILDPARTLLEELSGKQDRGNSVVLKSMLQHYQANEKTISQFCLIEFPLNDQIYEILDSIEESRRAAIESAKPKSRIIRTPISAEKAWLKHLTEFNFDSSHDLVDFSNYVLPSAVFLALKPTVKSREVENAAKGGSERSSRTLYSLFSLPKSLPKIPLLQIKNTPIRVIISNEAKSRGDLLWELSLLCFHLGVLHTSTLPAPESHFSHHCIDCLCHMLQPNADPISLSSNHTHPRALISTLNDVSSSQGNSPVNLPPLDLVISQDGRRTAKALYSAARGLAVLHPDALYNLLRLQLSPFLDSNLSSMVSPKKTKKATVGKRTELSARSSRHQASSSSSSLSTSVSSRTVSQKVLLHKSLSSVSNQKTMDLSTYAMFEESGSSSSQTNALLSASSAAFKKDLSQRQAIYPKKYSERSLLGTEVFLVGSLAERKEWAVLLAEAGARILNDDITFDMLDERQTFNAIHESVSRAQQTHHVQDVVLNQMNALDFILHFVNIGSQLPFAAKLAPIITASHQDTLSSVPETSELDEKTKRNRLKTATSSSVSGSNLSPLVLDKSASICFAHQYRSSKRAHCGLRSLDLRSQIEALAHRNLSPEQMEQHQSSTNVSRFLGQIQSPTSHQDSKHDEMGLGQIVYRSLKSNFKRPSSSLSSSRDSISMPSSPYCSCQPILHGLHTFVPSHYAMHDYVPESTKLIRDGSTRRRSPFSNIGRIFVLMLLSPSNPAQPVDELLSSGNSALNNQKDLYHYFDATHQEIKNSTVIPTTSTPTDHLELGSSMADASTSDLEDQNLRRRQLYWIAREIGIPLLTQTWVADSLSQNTMVDPNLDSRYVWSEDTTPSVPTQPTSNVSSQSQSVTTSMNIPSRRR